MGRGTRCGAVLVGLITITACSSGSLGNPDSGSSDGLDAGSRGDAGNDAGEMCSGDAEVWDAVISRSLACTNNSDCCVVFNGCLNAAQVVTAADFEMAANVWPECEGQCTDCSPPDVEVGCVRGTCTGINAGPDAGAGLMMNHCGDDDGGTLPIGESRFDCSD